jgi:hypothetical protein
MAGLAGTLDTEDMERPTKTFTKRLNNIPLAHCRTETHKSGREQSQTSAAVAGWSGRLHTGATNRDEICHSWKRDQNARRIEEGTR